MWPIQTLTLLLCLTDEEQLFAQKEPQQPVQVVIEMDEQQNKATYTELDLVWDPRC